LIDKLILVDNVIVSLDSMDEQINDRLCGIPGATSEVIANIKRFAEQQKQFGFKLSIHTVICADNLEEIDRIVEFCDQYRITLSVSPQHIDAYPCKDLVDNEQYSAAVGRLKLLKRAGKPIACSFGYLDKIERFSRHRCFPFLSPRIEPDGSVFFPCYQIRKQTRNLFDYPDLRSLMRQEGERMDGHGDCHERCFLACYLEVEQYVGNPLRLAREVSFRNLAIGPGRRAVEKGHSYKTGGRNG
jgi:MoaA/NifB/PqqE/SkfB family radical SAM enzyme